MGIESLRVRVSFVQQCQNRIINRKICEVLRVESLFDCCCEVKEKSLKGRC